MRYYYEKQKFETSMYGKDYPCDHPVYNWCTLYTMAAPKNPDGKPKWVGEIGLAVIQQRYDPITKHTYWGPIDRWLTDPIYLHPKFLTYFRIHASYPDGKKLYPTVTVRQIMWALRMKPMPKQPWETVFDHTDF